MILHTHISGEGEPIMLIHSGGMTGLTEYTEQAEFFSSRNFKVIRPDLRGHGKSVNDTDDFFTHCANDINETLASLHIDSCHIVGVSLGGLAALLFAKQYPSKVKSLTFSGIFPKKPDHWETLMKEEEERFETLFENEKVVSQLNQMHGKNDWKALLRSSTQPNWYPFHETGNISELTVPSLCIVGGASEDEFSAAVSFKQLNPAIHIATIPFAGHLVHREQPTLYTQMLYTFIETLKQAKQTIS